MHSPELIPPSPPPPPLFAVDPRAPLCCLQVEGQLEFFSQQLSPHSLAASQACAAAAAAEPDKHCQVMLSMLCSYKLPRLTSAKAAKTEGEESAMEQGHISQALRQDDWAPGAPWDSFANHGDPVGVHVQLCNALVLCVHAWLLPCMHGCFHACTHASAANKGLLVHNAPLEKQTWQRRSC